MNSGAHSTRWRCTAAVLLAMLLCSTPAHAEFERPPPAPMERLIQNLEAAAKETPDDLLIQYKLARTYYMAFTFGTKLIPASYDEQEPSKWNWIRGSYSWGDHLRYAEASRRAGEELAKTEFKPGTIRGSIEYKKLFDSIHAQLVADAWLPEPLTHDEMLALARKSLDLFGKAIEAKPKEALFLLGRASLLEDLVAFRARVKEPPEWVESIQPASLKDLYFETFEAAMVFDGARKELSIEGIENLVSYEAARRFLALTARDESEGERRTKATAGIATLKRIPQGCITPLAIPLDRTVRAPDLVSAMRSVPFDIDRDGNQDNVQWFTPRAGILVWDPNGAGEVLDGGQLVGNVTFGLFHRDGFEALALLDDDGDGELAGLELLGISIWIDADSDGVSDPGEVTPFCEMSGSALRAAPVRRDDIPWVERGALIDGEWRPVYDVYLEVGTTCRVPEPLTEQQTSL